MHIEETIRYDESTETSNDYNPVRILLIVAGSISLVLGIVGIVLPLLPTTPFLLLTAACYARSSERFYRWLITNRIFGRYIADYRAGLGMPLSAKITALVVLITTMSSTIIFFIHALWLRLLLGVICVTVATHILRLPTRKRIRVHLKIKDRARRRIARRDQGEKMKP